MAITLRNQAEMDAFRAGGVEAVEALRAEKAETKGPKLDYVKIMEQAFSEARNAPNERAYGCGRIYVVITDKDHVKGIAAAAKKLGRIFQRNAYYGMKNALYVGYDNASGKEMAMGAAVVRVLKANGISCYRDEHGD